MNCRFFFLSRRNKQLHQFTRRCLSQSVLDTTNNSLLFCTKLCNFFAFAISCHRWLLLATREYVPFLFYKIVQLNQLIYEIDKEKKEKKTSKLFLKVFRTYVPTRLFHLCRKKKYSSSFSDNVFTVVYNPTIEK